MIIFSNLTGQNRGLSGLKNIWPVIVTGDLLSVILSLEEWKFQDGVGVLKQKYPPWEGYGYFLELHNGTN